MCFILIHNKTYTDIYTYTLLKRQNIYSIMYRIKLIEKIVRYDMYLNNNMFRTDA